MKSLGNPAVHGREDVIYVIRTMSTTDMRPGQPPVPYHVYLLKPEKRGSAYWRRDTIDAIRFASVGEALEHGNLCLSDKRFDVVPLADQGVPTYWDAREGDYRGRVIGTTVQVDETLPPPVAMTA